MSLNIFPMSVYYHKLIKLRISFTNFQNPFYFFYFWFFALFPGLFLDPQHSMFVKKFICFKICFQIRNFRCLSRNLFVSRFASRVATFDVCCLFVSRFVSRSATFDVCYLFVFRFISISAAFDVVKKFICFQVCFQLESCFQIRNFPTNIETTNVKYRVQAETFKGTTVQL